MVPLYLATSRTSESQRKHFAIFIPDDGSLDPNFEGRGTLIHVFGAPMAGFGHEVLRGHGCIEAVPRRECVKLGELLKGGKEEVERVAMGIEAPRISENFLGPVDGVKNRRCQEWTMDFLKALVEKGYVGFEASEIAQAQRDSPAYGVGLRHVGDAGRG